MSFFSKKPKFPETEIQIGDYKPGHIDPTTGSAIKYICYQTTSFVVSIDSDVNLNWFADEMNYASDFGEIASQVSLAEALVDRIFVGKKNRIAYKKMLGDVLARILDEEDSRTAKPILEEVKMRIIAHSKERVRMSYISYAVFSVLFVGLLIILALLNKTAIINSVGGVQIFRIIICTLLGGIGAFITTFSRFQNYQGSIIAGLPIHRLDGFLRVSYGLIAGIIIALAIKGKVLAGFANSDEPWILYFFAMIAGASEALIPNLIRQAETQTNLTQTGSTTSSVSTTSVSATPASTTSSSTTATTTTSSSTTPATSAPDPAAGIVTDATSAATPPEASPGTEAPAASTDTPATPGSTVPGTSSSKPGAGEAASNTEIPATSEEVTIPTTTAPTSENNKPETTKTEEPASTNPEAAPPDPTKK